MNPAVALGAVFRRFGKNATYTPPGGGVAVPCRVLLNAADEAASLERGRFVVGSRVVEVRASEVPAPAQGGVFTLGAQAMKIAGAPKRQDDDQLVWTCGCSG